MSIAPPTSYFHTQNDQHWTRFPETLTDEKIIEAAASLGIEPVQIDREQGVVHFKGTYDQEMALHDMLNLWARESI